MTTFLKQVLSIAFLFLFFIGCYFLFTFLFFMLALTVFGGGLCLVYVGACMIKDAIWGIGRYNSNTGGWHESAPVGTGRRGAKAIALGLFLIVIGWKLLPIAIKFLS